LALDEPTANEAATPIDGIDVLISEELKSFVDKGTIDYKTEAWRKGFTIKSGGQSCC
jgi:Fe-S cluster assembly iron-binding protein IscA